MRILEKKYTYKRPIKSEYCCRSFDCYTMALRQNVHFTETQFRKYAFTPKILY